MHREAADALRTLCGIKKVNPKELAILLYNLSSILHSRNGARIGGDESELDGYR